MAQDTELAWNVVTTPDGLEVAVSTWGCNGSFESDVLLGGHEGNAYFPQVKEVRWNSEISAVVGHDLLVGQLRTGELDWPGRSEHGTRKSV